MCTRRPRLSADTRCAQPWRGTRPSLRRRAYPPGARTLGARHAQQRHAVFFGGCLEHQARPEVVDERTGPQQLCRWELACCQEPHAVLGTSRGDRASTSSASGSRSPSSRTTTTRSASPAEAACRRSVDTESSRSRGRAAHRLDSSGSTTSSRPCGKRPISSGRVWGTRHHRPGRDLLGRPRWLGPRPARPADSCTLPRWGGYQDVAQRVPVDRQVLSIVKDQCWHQAWRRPGAGKRTLGASARAGAPRAVAADARSPAQPRRRSDRPGRRRRRARRTRGPRPRACGGRGVGEPRRELPGPGVVDVRPCRVAATLTPRDASSRRLPWSCSSNTAAYAWPSKLAITVAGSAVCARRRARVGRPGRLRRSHPRR